jgi:hypothetical protein
MMNFTAWPRIIGGLMLGAAISFLIGCFYAYAEWHPPSNDWGNEKDSTTLLLVPVAVIGLVVALLARKAIRRGIVGLRRIGVAGLLAALVGAAILPVAEVGEVAAERLRVTSSLEADRAANLTKLSNIGAQLRLAEAVVLESQTWMAPGDLARLASRLSAFTSKAVFVPEPNPDRSKARQLREYHVAAGAACRAESGQDCPGTGAVVDFADWPASGSLLTIGQDQRPGSDGKALYPILALTALVKPAVAPDSPYAALYDPGEQPRTTWINACAIKAYGPFPFGRGVRWKICPDPLTINDIADRLFGPTSAPGIPQIPPSGQRHD